MQEWLRQAIVDKWHSRTGLVLALVAACVVLVPFFIEVDLTKLRWWQWLVLAIVLALTCVAWWWTHIPRVSPKKVGFGIALKYEETLEAQRFQADFVGKLKQLVQESRHLRHTFQFIEFDKRITERYGDATSINELVQKSGCHFVLFGTARTRVLGGASTFVVDLRGIVRHSEIDAEQRDNFQKDISEVLPGRLQVRDLDSLLAFEFAATQLDIVTRYVIGTAAALSRDLTYGEQLLLDANNRAEALSRAGANPVLASIRSRIGARLTEIYSLQLLRTTEIYKQRLDLTLLREAEEWVAKRRQFSADDYDTRSTAALCAFLLHHDVQAAWREVEAARTNADGSWRYSEAFLLAYEGDLDRAYRSYVAAFGMPLGDVTVPTQCEEFIQTVIEQEPDKYWLYFCLGMINHRVKGDLVAAKRDFEAFLRGAEEGRFQTQVRVVVDWLREIDTSLASSRLGC